ncbi:MAG: hypothetical protein K6F99_10335 [Lachnospiraceae bacterium]|nr:hypothetical protein [Lachnospiraceae bacterium]
MTTITWVLDIVAILLIITALFLNKKDVKAYKKEDELFGLLCLASVGIAVVKLIEDTLNPGLDLTSVGYSSVICEYFYDLIELVLLLIWILFVDYMIYRSKDHLRIIRPGIIKILVLIAAVETVIMVIALCFIGMKGAEAGTDNNLAVFIWVVISYYVLKLVEAGLLVRALLALSRYRKRRKGPVMFRGMPFYIPVFLGWLLTIIISYRIDLNPIATGLGLILLYISMKQERRYIDSETGYFTTDYLKLLSGGDKKRGYESGLGMLISADKNYRSVIDILKHARPENVDIIRVSKDSFFMVGERKPKSVIEFFGKNLSETAAEEGINLTVKFDLRGEGESAEALLERLCSGQTAK